MKNQALPEYISLSELTIKNEILDGTLALSNLGRLHDSIFNKEDSVQVKLKLSRDEEDRMIISGTVSGKLNLVCQRCMQPMESPIEIAIKLAVVPNEEASDALPDRYDPFVAKEDSISLYHLIEDELLLALPLVAKHSEEECPIKLQNSSQTGHNRRSDRKNPFEVLSTLKDKFK